MEFLMIIVALLTAEIVMWELPRFLAKRVILGVGLSICMAASVVVSSTAFGLMMLSPKVTEILNPAIVSFALFILFVVASGTVLWYEQQKNRVD
jgi:hypothetical protein